MFATGFNQQTSIVMAFKDVFKSNRQQKKEHQKNINFLKYLLFMAVSDEKLDETEFLMIQEVMLDKRGMSKGETVEEIKKMMKRGFSSKVQVPETPEEKEELVRFLASVMLQDHKIEQQEWNFLTMVVKSLYAVKKDAAHEIMRDMVRQLMATGEYSVTEVNIKENL